MAARVLPHRLVQQVILWKHKDEIREQEQTRRSLGLPSISALRLSSIRTSDTLFVLGSGRSINDMSEDCFAGIARHDSLGFNFWLAHPFVPTLYLFYPGATTNPEDRARLDGLFHCLMAERADEYREVPKIVTDLWHHNAGMIRGCPDAFMTRLHAAEREIIFARNPRELAHSLRALDARGVFAADSPAHPVERLFKYCASLTAVLALALHMGHKRVVLCGIDLHDSKYFYEDVERYPHMAGFHGSPTPGAPVHATIGRWSPLMMPIDEVVYGMRDVLYAPRGVELYVENAASALYPRIPVMDDTAWARL
jgi:hypothetical protein